MTAPYAPWGTDRCGDEREGRVCNLPTGHEGWHQQPDGRDLATIWRPLNEAARCRGRCVVTPPARETTDTKDRSVASDE